MFKGDLLLCALWLSVLLSLAGVALSAGVFKPNPRSWPCTPHFNLTQATSISVLPGSGTRWLQPLQANRDALPDIAYTLFSYSSSLHVRTQSATIAMSSPSHVCTC